MVHRTEGDALLRKLTGDANAAFRGDQWEAIDRLVNGRGRVLVVQRTGWGKSAVYFLATRFLRDAGAGATLLVSPLLALMRNQVLMGERAGIHAATLNSANVDEWEAIEAGVLAGRVDLLLVSPERLNNERFRAEVLPHLVRSLGLVVVDEAHCISDWGHDFRPDYRRIRQVLDGLAPSTPVLCTTATANERVVADVVEQIGAGITVLRGPLDRPTLELGALDLPQRAHRLAWLAQVVPRLPGSGIVYCLTVDDTERVAAWLAARGIPAEAYSGATDPERRLEIEDALLRNDLKVVVATSALGMGFDKPDLGFVVHYQSPGSPIAYYQQVGRAGRAIDRAVGVILSGREDAAIHDYFVRTAFPPREQAEEVLSLLSRDGPLRLRELESRVNVGHTRLESMLKILELEGAVERRGGAWSRTTHPWTYDDERVALVTQLRRDEQQAMADYIVTSGCRMRFLRQQLDDAGAADCGRCDTCTGRTWALDLDPDLVARADAHLRSRPLVIQPRAQWPAGAVDGLGGRIPVEERTAGGRALGAGNDGGWGRVVQRARRSGDPYPDELVGAAASLVAEWQPDPAPRWVTYVPGPSADRVADFAADSPTGSGCRSTPPCAGCGRRARRRRWRTAPSSSATSTAPSPSTGRSRPGPPCSSTRPSARGGRRPWWGASCGGRAAPPCSRSPSRCLGAAEARRPLSRRVRCRRPRAVGAWAGAPPIPRPARATWGGGRRRSRTGGRW